MVSWFAHCTSLAGRFQRVSSSLSLTIPAAIACMGQHRRGVFQSCCRSSVSMMHGQSQFLVPTVWGRPETFIGTGLDDCSRHVKLRRTASWNLPVSRSSASVSLGWLLEALHCRYVRGHDKYCQHVDFVCLLLTERRGDCYVGRVEAEGAA